MSDSEPERAFLEIKHSLSGKCWNNRLNAAQIQQAKAIAQAHDFPEILGRVLAARNLDIQGAETFLNPTLRDLMTDPSSITDLDRAVQILAEAITTRKKIAIFGDYDVDGASSSALVSMFLTHYGVEHEIYIPDRITEGYGPNPQAIEALAQNGAKLLVTVDCGTTSFEALEKAAQLGLEVVVIDHHQVGDELPKCGALVNPNRHDDLSSLGHLCAAGVVFMVLVGLSRFLRNASTTTQKPPDLLAWLDVVALATVCDVVPLVGVNRAFVTQGLQIFRKRSNLGLSTLADNAGMDGPPTPYHLGFVLGPRINAGGRIGNAQLGAQLLTCQDPDLAGQLAEQLNGLNRARQQEEARMLEVALAEAEKEMAAESDPVVLVTESQDWHPGIVGLVASRIKERFNRPAFAIAFDGLGKGSGSGRSIPGVDIGTAVRAALDQNILIKGGGHSQAAGLTLEKTKLGEFRSFMEHYLKHAVMDATAQDILEIDGAMTARSASMEQVQLLERAGPFGPGNTAPVIVFPAHKIRYVETFGNNHMRLTLISGDGTSIKAVAFGIAQSPLGRQLKERRGETLHFAGNLSINHWRGQSSVQFRIIDAANPAQLY